MQHSNYVVSNNKNSAYNKYSLDRIEKQKFEQSNKEKSLDSQVDYSKRPFQMRVDSVDYESTAPITESNSREDLIVSNEHFAEAPPDFPRKPYIF